MYRVRTMNAIARVGLDRLPGGAYEVASDLSDPDALLVRSADLHAIEIPASVKAVARAGAGTNNIPVTTLSKRGIPVFNTPGANANAVKELVIAGMLLGARNIVPALDFARSLKQTDKAEMDAAVEKGKKAFVGIELPGRTLGVIGLGAIGVQVANAALSLNMRVLGFDPQITVQHAWQLWASAEHAHSIDDVFRRSDVVTVHVPLVEGTRGLIDAAKLSLMKPDAVLLNFARGPIVDEDAVLAALDSGTLGAYVCDFPSPKLAGHAKVVATPHLGASTGEAEDNCAMMAADELRGFLERGEIVNSVNFPDALLPRADGTARIAIANENVPNMVGRITALVADAGLNIADLLNKSRGGLAYTLVDLDGVVPVGLLDKIQHLPGVLNARAI